jgi:aspartate carbamoyltransferase catalytic subunit
MIETQQEVNLVNLHKIDEFKGGEHIFSAEQFSPAAVNKIKEFAEFLRRWDEEHPEHVYNQILEDTICAYLFWQSQKETGSKFKLAIEKLGGKLIGSDDMTKESSSAKGETIEDTIRTISGYADLAIIGHVDEELQKAIKIINKPNSTNLPIINANIKDTDELNFDVYTIMSILTLVTQRFV